ARAPDAPTPTLPPRAPTPPGRARTTVVSSDVASMVRSPPRRIVRARTEARVSWSTMAMPTDPATDAPPAAPEEAVAVTVDVVSAVASGAAVARTTRFAASIVTVAGTTAWLRTVERVRATPAPIAAVPPPVAEPSAVLAASALVAVAMVTVPAAVTAVTPGAMMASAVTFEMTTPTAAATETLPSEVAAEGAAPEPEPAIP